MSSVTHRSEELRRMRRIYRQLAKAGSYNLLMRICLLGEKSRLRKETVARLKPAS
jgi:hypothetical protein